jgi:transcriptional regulator with XRE-family HTH domain
MQPEQMRAARAELNWSLERLAEVSGVHRNTLSNFETRKYDGEPEKLAAVRRALEAAGVIFIEENGQAAGVRLRRFHVGDLVRFRAETRVRLSYDIAADEVGTVVGVEPHPPRTGPTYQIEVQFPRARVPHCFRFEYELVHAAPDNVARTPKDAMSAITPNVSKDDVDAFCNFCIPLRAIWRHYQMLFEGTDLKRELLQSIAPTFFGDINRLLIEHLILKICQITDPEESMGRKNGRKNLTVKFLINNSNFSTAPRELDKLKRLSDSMHGFRAKIVPARNRLIGHLDRESVLHDHSLGDAPSNEWNQFWLDLQDFLNIMHKHYVDPNGQFYLNGVGYLSDADSLVKALKESTYFQTLLDNKETTKQSADVAFNSKFSEA